MWNQSIIRTMNIAHAYANPDILTVGHALMVGRFYVKLQATNAFCFQWSAKNINSWALKWHLATSAFVWIDACMQYIDKCCNAPFLHPGSSVERYSISLRRIQSTLTALCYGTAASKYTVWFSLYPLYLLQLTSHVALNCMAELKVNEKFSKDFRGLSHNGVCVN